MADGRSFWKEGTKMKDIVLLIGRTGSGKSTIARKVSELSNGKLSEVMSYATRPKRPGEDMRPTHIFITPEEVKDFRGRMAAYTKIGEYEYFTTWDELMKHPVYVIDPRGEKDLRRNISGKGLDLRLHTFYVKVPEEERLKRVYGRDKDRSVTEARLRSEDGQFSEFEKSLSSRGDEVTVLDNSEGKAMECAWRILYILGM